MFSCDISVLRRIQFTYIMRALRNADVIAF